MLSPSFFRTGLSKYDIVLNFTKLTLGLSNISQYIIHSTSYIIQALKIQRIKLATLFLIFFLTSLKPVSAQSLIPDSVQLKEFILHSRYITVTQPYKKGVIDSSAIASSAASNLGELLSNSSSAFIKTHTPGGLSTANLRGNSAQHVQVYWNGISLNSPSLGLLDLSLIPVSFLDGAEIHHGAGSLIDGSGGLSGSIQLNSKVNWDKQLQVRLSHQTGSFGHQYTEGRFQLTQERFQTNTRLFYHEAVNDFPFQNITQLDRPTENMENAELKRVGLLQEFSLRANQKNDWSLRIWYTDNERNIPAPMGIPAQKESSRDELLMTSLEWNHVGKKGELILRSAYVRGDADYHNENISLYSNILNQGIRNQLRWHYHGWRQTLLRVFVHSNYDQVQSAGFQQKETLLNHSIVGSLDRSIGNRLLGSILIRSEVWNQQFIPFLPSIGGRYQLFKQQEIYIRANLARNFRMPTLNDWYWHPGGNPELKPENSLVTEGALEVLIPVSQQIKASVQATTFYNLIDNWIIWLPNQYYWTAQNVRKVKSTGLEIDLGLEGQYNQLQWKLKVAYTYTSSTSISTTENPDNIVGKQLIYVPFHNGYANISLNWKNFHLSYQQQYSGKYFITTDNNSYMPTYSTAHLRLAYHLKTKNKHTFHFYGAINNLWNKAYQIMPYRPMPGRHYKIGITYQLNHYKNL